MAPGNTYRKCGKVWSMVFETREQTERHTNRHTYTLIAIPRIETDSTSVRTAVYCSVLVFMAVQNLVYWRT